ncbi:hypothetical protein SacxiDRAFT_1487 [Saccharomonospora xinjiangensis XJ-54]|uniref:Uncharacterized protein n=2 Tax=Saccharomonospora TaxID=1851 RepID=I0V0T2_9PSEU|nr:hypothetical protein SacxiDRAFT_1487 [Saccharomonospora xinjiangensis XJ-54]
MGALIPGGGALSMAMAAMDKTMGAKAMAEVIQSTDRLVESAKTGGFTVTKEGADPIIKVLEKFMEEVKELRAQLAIDFDQEPKLGEHDYGKRVALHMWEAANDERSPRAALTKLSKILERSRIALLIASDQYQEQEESARDIFRKMGE